jgi:hypothetical protein
MIDQGSSMSKEDRREAWEEAHRGTVGWLFANNVINVVK